MILVSNSIDADFNASIVHRKSPRCMRSKVCKAAGALPQRGPFDMEAPVDGAVHVYASRDAASRDAARAEVNTSNDGCADHKVKQCVQCPCANV